MTSKKSWLSSFTATYVTKQVKIANGQNIDILGYNDICLYKHLTLNGVLYVPSLDCNLVSVRKLMLDNNCLTVFS